MSAGKVTGVGLAFAMCWPGFEIGRLTVEPFSKKAMTMAAGTTGYALTRRRWDRDPDQQLEWRRGLQRIAGDLAEEYIYAGRVGAIHTLQRGAKIERNVREKEFGRGEPRPK
jgi:hypothetical protein